MEEQRSKMLGAIAIIGIVGFILGIVANFFYFKALPYLIEVFPQILEVDWVVWGVVGALLAIICCVIYAYLP
jgi:ABC-type antimicrobial peptide transport system permease subunit